MDDQEKAEAGERLDLAALAVWIDAHDLPGRGEPIEAHFISGGASNEIYALSRGDSAMVLRKPPRRVPKGRNETMLREHRVLAALADSDVPHPRALAVCDDTAVLGSCFYLMEHVDGWSPMQTEGHWPAPFDADLGARRGLAFELVDGIARLGQVDWRKAGLEGFGKPEGFLERQVDRWLHHLGGFKFRALPGLEEAAEWLRGHTPKAFRPGILHGDYQFANVMFRHAAPARLAAIVDWEMATIGDPLLDLAWVLMSWPDPEERGEDAVMTYVDYAGMPSRAELAAHYAELSGLPVDALDYYVVLARFKMACVLEGGYARYVKGAADNPKMQAFGEVVLDMARRA
ncbi:MAG: phosphotransferase family protein, partial [Deltaproteobacteria bacterium]|nr:phosphotransferase family protein [Deltaproteobacteria bacterium]